MINGKKVIGIIPARGGSKRLPGKNIKELGGKPLIAWSIEAAIDSKVLDTVIVNTDDVKISDIAKNYNAEIPFIRSKTLATDTASTIDVIIDTLMFYRERGVKYDVVVLLQPTSPLRNSMDVLTALEMFTKKNAKSVISVCEVDHPIQWCNTLNDSHGMDNFIQSEFKGLRSQDLPTNYRINGALFIWDVDELIKKQESILIPAFASVMPRSRSVDIDEPIDFKIAEALIEGTF